MLWCWIGLWIASHSRLCINGPSEPGRLTDVCVCQWVKWSIWGQGCLSTGLLKMIVGVLATCHTQYTWDRSIFFYLIEQHSKFLLHTLQVLYICTLCDSRNINTHSWNVSTQNAFSLPFVAILVNCAPSGEMHNYCTSLIIKENFGNFLIHRCNYIFLSQVYCVWHWGRSGSFKLFKRPFPGFLTILTL